MQRTMSKALTVAAALAVMVTAACTDTTVQPKSSVTSANIFNDPNAYQELLARVYAGLAVSGQQGPAGNADIQGIDEGFSQYLRLYWEMEELPTDAAVIGWTDIGLPEMNTQTWTSSSTMVVAMYYRVMFQVTMANEFLRQSTDAAVAARGQTDPTLLANIKQYRAEARFLRALAYWHGLDLFGSIPLVTENDPLGVAPSNQAPRDSLFRFAVRELHAIQGDLPTFVPGHSAVYGRATDAADHFLLAEMYLNAESYGLSPRYDSALTEAQAVIGSGATLDPNFQHLFQADNDNSPEIIFPIIEDGNFTQSYGGVTFLMHAGCGGNMNAANYGIDYCWGGTRMKPEIYNLFSPGDARGAFIYTSGQKSTVDTITNFNDGYAAPKFTNITSGGAQGSNPTFVDTDFPMFRLGEAYLIAAEAMLRGGGGSQAQAEADVNLLRARAGVANVPAGTMTLDTILAERGRELLWEAHRRTDLVRFGLFTGGTYLWSWKGEQPVVGGSPVGKATDSYRNLYPLPATELIANPNLKQNPGY